MSYFLHMLHALNAIDPPAPCLESTSRATAACESSGHGENNSQLWSGELGDSDGRADEPRPEYRRDAQFRAIVRGAM